jgi:putative oxygen-independent coproporphyrinogen III oxidase
VDTSSVPGFGIYVHWPFCAAKCPYCDFNSHVVKNVDQEAWADALCRELAHMAGLQDERPVTSIFFGGGTPSLMQGETVARVLEEIRSLWPWTNNVEITLEANPTSVEAGRFTAYADAGINRLSLGVQSLDPEALSKLGRLHTVDEARAAFELARATFPRLSFDLIYARPGQTLEAWEDELKEALTFAADHLSLYQLTLEPGTPFYELGQRGALVLPEDETARALYDLTGEICSKVGLAAYEVSNYAAQGAQSRHNLTYWRYGDYIGVGAGAHGRLSLGGKRFATSTLSQPGAWLESVSLKGHALQERSEISPEAQGEEFLLMGLRLASGIEKRRYEKLVGRVPDWSALTDLKDLGLLAQDEQIVQASQEGRLVLNTLIAEISARLSSSPN